MNSAVSWTLSVRCIVRGVGTEGQREASVAVMAVFMQGLLLQICQQMQAICCRFLDFKDKKWIRAAYLLHLITDMQHFRYDYMTGKGLERHKDFTYGASQQM